MTLQTVPNRWGVFLDGELVGMLEHDRTGWTASVFEEAGGPERFAHYPTRSGALSWLRRTVEKARGDG